jgi:hypothetical protein
VEAYCFEKGFMFATKPFLKGLGWAYTANAVSLWFALLPDCVKEFYDEYRWRYECRLLSQPDKIVAYLYIAPS